MALILQKTRFKGERQVKHVDFRPYYNEPKFYERALASFPPIEGDQEGEAVDHDEHMGDDEDPNQPQMELEPQHGWAPPAGYFDPYFQSM